MTKWKIGEEKNITTFKADADALAIHPLLLAKASRRNIFDVESFFRPTQKNLPSFQEIFSTDFSAQMLQDKKIALYADYDVDGMTAAYITELALKNICSDLLVGYADLESGFGIRRSFVEEALEWGADWLITLDCGSSDSKEIAFAQNKGLKTIIIDHHNFDEKNPTDYHFNPQFEQYIKQQAFQEWVTQSQEVLSQVKYKQKQKSVGLEVDLQKEIQSGNKLLEEANQKFFQTNPIKKLQIGIQRASTMLLNKSSFSHLTGSALAWIFGFYCIDSKNTEWWFQEPLYLASLGVLADMGSLLHPHNRAIYQLSKLYPPQGIKNLAKAFEEDAYTPTSLIRTRAALNLAKRTKIKPDIVPQTLRGDEMKATILAMEAISASTRKTALQTEAEQQTEQQTENTFLSVILEKGQKDAGQSGVIANSLARKYQKPTIVFIKKSDGSYKFSARNTYSHKKIGTLITDSEVIDITDNNLGGHEDVVSGNCQNLQKVEKLIAYLQTWADKVKPKQAKKEIWVDLVVKHPKEVELIIQQTKQLLAPIGHDNWGISLGVIGILHQKEDTFILEIGEEEKNLFVACSLASEDMKQYVGETRAWKLRLDEREVLWLKESEEL